MTIVCSMEWQSFWILEQRAGLFWWWPLWAIDLFCPEVTIVLTMSFWRRSTWSVEQRSLTSLGDKSERRLLLTSFDKLRQLLTSFEKRFDWFWQLWKDVKPDFWTQKSYFRRQLTRRRSIWSVERRSCLSDDFWKDVKPDFFRRAFWWRQFSMQRGALSIEVCWRTFLMSWSRWRAIWERRTFFRRAFWRLSTTSDKFRRLLKHVKSDFRRRSFVFKVQIESGGNFELPTPY